MKFSLYNDDPSGTHFLCVAIMRGELEVRRFLLPPPAKGECSEYPCDEELPAGHHLVVTQGREWVDGDPVETTEVSVEPS